MKRIMIAALLLLSACKDSKKDDTVTTTVTGSVFDDQLQPLVGAVVAGASGMTTTTDARGAYTLVEPSMNDALIVSYTAKGFGRTWVRRVADGNAKVITVTLKPAPAGVHVTLPADGAAPLKVSARDGRSAITIPGGALCSGGITATGDAEVSFIYYDPLDARTAISFVESNVMPGVASLTPRNIGGELDVLIRQGEVTLEVCNGKTVQLVDAIPDGYHPKGETMFLDPTTGRFSDIIQSVFDPAAHTMTVNSRSLFPHCPASCGSTYCNACNYFPDYGCGCGVYCPCGQPGVEPDCAGNCGGNAAVDCNGVCNGGAVPDCTGACGGGAGVDCAGACNGGSQPDCAGVCNGPNRPDCAGVCNGGAVYDCNGTCGGGLAADCKGVCGGNATPAQCNCPSGNFDCNGTCDGTAVADCNGTCGGGAQRDCAGTCNGYAQKDCAGICNGGTPVDCNGTCGGGAVRDCLGTCGGHASASDCQCGSNIPIDCAGVCGGSHQYDCAGNCGGNTGYDCAGHCGGTATVGCDGVCGSGKVKDCLGVCGGTTSGAACTCVGTLGCDGVCNSGKVVGGCDHACGSTKVADCFGTCGGSAENQGCGCGVACPCGQPGVEPGCDGICGSGKIIGGCDHTCGSTKVDNGCGCGFTCASVEVKGTVTDIQGHPTVTQMTVNTLGDFMGQQTTTTGGGYDFQLGLIKDGGHISALVTPAPRPNQRIEATPAFFGYPSGTTVVNFQYCVEPDAHCVKGDHCCGGLTCQDCGCQ